MPSAPAMFPASLTSALVVIVLIVALGGPSCAPLPSGECTDRGTCLQVDGDANGRGDGGEAGPSGSACLAEEICGNGFDDDCNGLSDCDDPVCGSFACYPAAPNGWEGPVVLDARSGLATASACPSSYPAQALEAASGIEDAPPAQCRCGCAMPIAAHCIGVDARVVLYADTQCSRPCDSSFTVSNQCVVIVGADCVALRAAPEQAPRGGSCAPEATVTLPPAIYRDHVRACALEKPAAAGGCASGSVCAPKPPSPFLPNVCILQRGDVPCPEGPFTERVVVTELVDERGCEACSCGPPSGGTCRGDVELHTTDDCFDVSPAVAPLTNACVPIPRNTARMERGQLRAGGGTCDPSEPRARGEVVLSTSATACCLP